MKLLIKIIELMRHALFISLLYIISSTTSADVFQSRIVSVEEQEYTFQIYVPDDIENRQEKPSLILFLHGAGERGFDGIKQTTVGIGSFIKQTLSTFPAIVVMPQCEINAWWSDTKMEKITLAALEQTITEFNADRESIYLTGLSMGGYGTWNLAAKHPGLFAAIIPISARLQPPQYITPGPGSIAAEFYGEAIVNETAKRVCNIPIMLFHGKYDDVVPVEESRKINTALTNMGCPVFYTEYIDGGHDIWDRAYKEPNIFKWLLAQKLNHQHLTPVSDKN